MPKTVFGVVVMMLSLTAGVSAQGHAHGAPRADTAQAADSTRGMQGMMQRSQDMQLRMQSMQQMRQMRMQQSHTAGAQQGMQGMQGMGGQQTRARDQSCIAGSQQAGLSALLMGSVAELGLTEEQGAELQEILDRAHDDALEALTPSQREQLEAGPVRPSATCPTSQRQGAARAN